MRPTARKGASEGESSAQDVASIDFRGVSSSSKVESPRANLSGHRKLGKFVALCLAAATIGGLFTGTAHAAYPQARSPVAVESVQRSPVTLQAQDVRPQGASFDVAPTSHGFGNAPVAIKRFEGSDHKAVHGQTFHHRYSYDRLDLKGGGLTLYSTDLAESASPDFHSQAKGDWTTYGHLRPAGQAGRFVSVVSDEGGSMGSSPRATHGLATIDTREKREVTLDELLSAKDLQSVHSQIDRQLAANPKAAAYRQDRETLNFLVNKNFSLNQEGGNTTLTVLLPSKNSDKVAEFSFSLPSSVHLD